MVAQDEPNWTLPRRHVELMARCWFDEPEIDTILRIAYRESHFRTLAWNRSGEDSRGLTQINTVDNANPNYRGVNLFDPYVNLWAAWLLWSRYGWRPWATQAGLNAGLWAHYTKGDAYPETLPTIPDEA